MSHETTNPEPLEEDMDRAVRILAAATLDAVNEKIAALREELRREIEREHDRHMTKDHQFGAIGELVDTAVALRFQDYAKFLIGSESAAQISQAAAQFDAAVDQELSGAQEDEAAS